MLSGRLQSSTQMMTVCWLFVSGIIADDVFQNVALNKPAKQISTFPYKPGFARLAVDGNTDGNFNHGHCSHTNTASNGWWKVDLLGFYSVANVEIFPRTDQEMERLQHFEVRVSTLNPKTFPSHEGQLCAYYPDIVPTDGVMLRCSAPIAGRYVSIFKASYSYLTLCEVRVLPSPAGSKLFGLSYAHSRLSGPVLLSLTSASSVLCAAECAKTNQCFAFNLKAVPSQASAVPMAPTPLRAAVVCELLDYGNFSAFQDAVPVLLADDEWSVFTWIS